MFKQFIFDSLSDIEREFIRSQVKVFKNRHPHLSNLLLHFINHGSETPISLIIFREYVPYEYKVEYLQKYFTHEMAKMTSGYDLYILDITYFFDQRTTKTSWTLQDFLLHDEDINIISQYYTPLKYNNNFNSDDLLIGITDIWKD